MVNKVAQRAIAAGLAGMMSFGAVAPAAMALDTNTWSSWWYTVDTTSDEGLTYWKRIAGDDRYGTMKKIVEATYKIGSNNYWNASVAVVASGENFPDALAANGLAGALNGGDGAPVILTKKGALSSQAKDLLKNLSVQTVYIMGGTSAVSAETEQQIKDLKIATVRVAGADRQATSVEAFKLIDGNWFKNHGTHSVIIATGANYADALSIAPFAYKTGTPIVLTKADGTLTDAAVKAIKDNDEIWQVIVVGGTAAVSDSVFSALGTYTGNYKDYYNKVYVPVRIAGADRYDTSAKVADWEINYALDPNSGYWNGAGFSFAETFVATGENFPDALAGGQLAGGKYYANKSTNFGRTMPSLKASSPILLTKDGNRSADAVIASNLAWNMNTVSVDAYDIYEGEFGTYLDQLLSMDTIAYDVWESDAHGFFTEADLLAATTESKTPRMVKLTNPDGSVIDANVYELTVKKETYWGEVYPVGTLFANPDSGYYADKYVLLDQNGDPKPEYEYSKYYWVESKDLFEDGDLKQVYVTKADILDEWGGWILGGDFVTVGNNFNGYIFGGKAAVSKDKAKQLDETVDGAIRKVYDSTAASEYESVTINGVKYNTLSWLFNNCRNRMSVLGVEWGFDISDLVGTNMVIAVPTAWAVKKNAYNYLYQPVTFKTDNTKYAEDGSVVEQKSTIKFAVFDRTASFAKDVYTNSYSGYGLTGYKTLDLTAKKEGTTWTYTASWE